MSLACAKDVTQKNREFRVQCTLNIDQQKSLKI